MSQAAGLALMLTVVFAVQMADAQSREAAVDRPAVVVSPEIQPDGRVTVRLLAPQAAASSFRASSALSHRGAVAAVIAVVVVSAAQAADPWSGTWVLNVAKSTFSPGPPPRAQTITIESIPSGWLHVVTEGVDAEGRKTYTERRARFDGLDYPAQGFPRPTTQAFTRIDDRRYQIVSKQGGVVVTRTTVTVSTDGQTMTTVTFGENDLSTINNRQVFDRKRR
jgi:hypothetical protein